MLSERLEFVIEHAEEILDSIPAAPAVFLLRGEDEQSQPYATKTADLRRRLQRLLGIPAEQSKRLNLRGRVRWIEFTVTGSDFESGFLLYRVLRETFPETYSERMRLRFAPLIKLHLENQHPRASITTRPGRINGSSMYYGPFPTRVMAEKFANDALDFFKMRRCVEDLIPDPLFPGCIYSEMKMCLAPCFNGCTSDEYRTEVAKVQAYFDSNGESLLREISAQRDELSAKMDFEGASVLHARLDKLKAAVSQLPEIVRRIDHLNGVLLQPSALPNCVTLFRIHRGQIFRPVPFPIQAGDHAKSQSMESRLNENIASIPEEEMSSSTEAAEHLAILRRWFYRSSRVGEIFFADEKGALPMRRMVRGISRVFRGEKPEIIS